MKWFKHYSDAYTNLKLRVVRQEFKAEGYGLYWMCLELVAQQGGLEFELLPEKQWKQVLQFESGVKPELLDQILTKFGELGLIDAKKLTSGTLFIPKMTEYQDEYREKVGRGRDTIPLDKIRTDKNRTDAVAGKDLNKVLTAFKALNPMIRYENLTQRAAVARLIKQLGLDEVLNAVNYLAANIGKDYLPVITTPVQLEQKYASLLQYLERQKTKK